MHAVALGVFRILKTPMAHLEIAPNPENVRNIVTVFWPKDEFLIYA